VSARTGKPQRAHLVQDRGGERIFTGPGEIRAVLSDWLARVNGWRRIACPSPSCSGRIRLRA